MEEDDLEFIKLNEITVRRVGFIRKGIQRSCRCIKRVAKFVFKASAVVIVTGYATAGLVFLFESFPIGLFRFRTILYFKAGKDYYQSILMSNVDPFPVSYLVFPRFSFIRKNFNEDEAYEILWRYEIKKTGLSKDFLKDYFEIIPLNGPGGARHYHFKTLTRTPKLRSHVGTGKCNELENCIKKQWKARSYIKRAAIISIAIPATAILTIYCGKNLKRWLERIELAIGLKKPILE